jgi:hypothetical protein
MPPLPPISTAERQWFGSNINSVDFLDVADADLSGIDVVSIYVQWILEDERYQKLLESGFLSKLRAKGIPLAIEMGSLKPGDYHGENAQANLPIIAQRVVAGGHKVCHLVMDEPLTGVRLAYDANGNLITVPPVQPLEESAFAIAKFVEKAREAMPGVNVGWAEAWPNVDLEEMRKCLMILDSWGCHLDGWHLDIDWKRAANEHKDANGTIAHAKHYADQYRTPLGVYFAGYPTNTDQEFQQGVLDIANGALPSRPYIDHVLVQSWAVRKDTNKQDIPANLPEFGLLETQRKVRETWD